MASPFAAFRKYQAILLAVFGVIIILLFAVGDPLMQMTQSRGGGEDPVAVEYKGGHLTQHELGRMVYSRRAAAEFLYQLRGMAWRARLQQMNIRQQIPPETRDLILNDYSLLPENTVRSMLLARKAADMGVRVSTDELYEYLRSAGYDVFDNAMIEAMARGSDDEERKRPLDSILEPIRQELTAQKLVRFLQQRLSLVPGGMQEGLRFSTPAEQFAYYNRTNVKAKADVVAIPVDEFLSQVPAPTEDQLRSYFDQYKDKLPKRDTVGIAELDSATPGFKLPHRVKIQYVKADMGDFVDRHYKDVTDEEIAKYYEQNKHNYRELSFIEDGDKNKKKNGKPAGGQETKPVAQGSAPAKAEEEPSSTPMNKGEESKPSPSSSKSPTLPRAAMANRVTGDNEADSKKEDGKGAAKTQPVAQGTGAATLPTAQGTIGTLPAAQGSTADDYFADREPKFKPLSAVKEEVRKEVARQKAIDDIEKRFRTIAAWLQKTYEVRLLKNEDAKKPVNVDAKAKDNHMTAKTTDLLSFEQLRDEPDIGKSYDPRSGQGLPVTVFSGSADTLHRVTTTVEEPPSSDHYLSWKIEDEPEKVPTLEESLRKQVAKQWQRGTGLDEISGKAQDLALKAAEQVAEKIRKGAPVAEAAKSVPGAKVIETDFFSWLTSGDVPSPTQTPSEPPKLSRIDEIDQPGPEFMHKVFSLKPGEVGVAMNHPKTMAYVIKVREVDTNPKLMVENFVAELESQKSRTEANVAAQLETLELSRRLFEKIDKDYRLEWKIPPSELATRIKG